MSTPQATHPITAASTSIAAFVDVFAAGPLNRAVRIRSFVEFERQYGGLDQQSEASYAIRQFFLNGGTDASVVRVATPTRLDVIGDPDDETGLFALVDDFNLLCLPMTVRLLDADAAAVAAAAEALCRQRRAFYLLDIPQTTAVRDSVATATAWIGGHAPLRSRDAATYFPRVNISDPLNSSQLRPTPASGTMAGLYARIDASRGVWHAPAGSDATLVGVPALECAVTDAQAAALGALGINALRTFPGRGPMSWGARTLAGTDEAADGFRYVSVRRLALFIEESLDEGTTWVVLEENAAPLWAQIRLDVTAFMQKLFKQGALQGRTPREAYFVKCDQQTTTEDDINRGVVNIVVGFAPLKPAEFVIVEIRQLVTP